MEPKDELDIMMDRIKGLQHRAAAHAGDRE